MNLLSDPVLADLLAPLSPQAPCGEDLAFSGAFDRIARAREHDDPSLAQGAWVTALKVADWPSVVQASEELLRTRSKDLRLAGWWAEGRALTLGFSGLGQGLGLISGLINHYWAEVHPRPDGDDHDLRIGALAWLLARLAPISVDIALPLGRPAATSAYTLAQIHRIRTAQAPSDDPRLTPERLARSLRDTPAATWQQLLGEVQACRAALAEMEAAVDAHLGVDGPSFLAAREALDLVRHELVRLARDAGFRDADDAAASPGSGPARAQADADGDGVAAAGSEGAGGAVGVAGAAAAARGPIANRADAVQRLREVADWFRRSEPHSPVAYLADKAVQWAGMPLHEWLRTVVKDAGSLAHVEELLGLNEVPSPTDTPQR